MISISGRKWKETKVNSTSVEKIKQDFNYSNILSKLIISRNYDLLEIENINNHIDISNDFMKDNDFIKGTDLITHSIKYKENICIVGDYDVDGSVATSLFVRFFNHIKQPHFFYIPDREKDGYGVSIKLFKKFYITTRCLLKVSNFIFCTKKCICFNGWSLLRAWIWR